MTIQFCTALPLAIVATASAVGSVRADAPAAVDPVRFVPGAVAADAGAATGTGYGWGGYDGATTTPLVGATAEVRLSARLVVGAGATYAARDGQDRAELRPSAFARYQILDQASRGFDVGAAVAYRQDRFVSEEGMFQVALALGVHGDTGAALMSLGYGQDGEGDDHLGDARLVAFRRLADTLHVGFDGHVQWLFDSSDPNRAQHGTPSLELTVAPAIVYGVGPVMLTLEVGWSAVDFEQLRSGALAVGGIGASFWIPLFAKGILMRIVSMRTGWVRFGIATLTATLSLHAYADPAPPPEPPSAMPVRLATGQFITPTAPRGAVQQALNPRLPAYPDFIALLVAHRRFTHDRCNRGACVTDVVRGCLPDRHRIDVGAGSCSRSALREAHVVHRAVPASSTKPSSNGFVRSRKIVPQPAVVHSFSMAASGEGMASSAVNGKSFRFVCS